MITIFLSLLKKEREVECMEEYIELVNKLTKEQNEYNVLMKEAVVRHRKSLRLKTFITTIKEMDNFSIEFNNRLLTIKIINKKIKKPFSNITSKMIH